MQREFKSTATMGDGIHTGGQIAKRLDKSSVDAPDVECNSLCRAKTKFNLRSSDMPNVLVTGTSKGIGYATALELARTGHTVYATMRDPGRAPELGEAVAKEKLPVKILVMDVDSDESVAKAFGEIRAQGGQIDAIVNNAGIERTGAIEELPLEDFRAVMETNYFGALRCIQAVLPEMRKRKSGCIINVTSVAGRIASSPLAPYTASKWALEALSEALAQEVKQFNIRVAIVEPGIIDTAMARRIEAPVNGTRYRHTRRFAGLFQASFAAPVDRGPAHVGKKILEIIESGTWQLRHPVGPDAAPFLDWRKGMTDEQWADWGSLDDEAWYARVQRDFGLDARPKN
jgi:NAD(P)-dependent dehydrogenase (short-subunit alcohol dehydrogenase family)